MAIAGDRTMLIFCLKNLAGWTDKQEQIMPDGTNVIRLAYKIDE
jgi:hypothetical protein